MLQALKQRREDEQGFTLIELMVVVLIIAILLAIAIPTFLGAQERAKDRAAQSNLRNAYTAAKTVFTDTQTWIDHDDDTAGTLNSLTLTNEAEPNLTIGTAASDDKAVISLDSTNGAATSDEVTFGVRSDTGKCYFINEVVVADAGSNAVGTWFNATDAPNATCDAAAVPAGSEGWQVGSFPSV